MGDQQNLQQYQQYQQQYQQYQQDQQYQQQYQQYQPQDQQQQNLQYQQYQQYQQYPQDRPAMKSRRFALKNLRGQECQDLKLKKSVRRSMNFASITLSPSLKSKKYCKKSLRAMLYPSRLEPF